MLISRRSPKRRDAFRSRFRDGAGDFPLRRYLRCREDLFSGMVHALLLFAFLVAVVFLGLSLRRVFEMHGARLNPWYGRGTLILVGAFWLLLLRRLLRKVAEIRETRQEMFELRAELERRHRDEDEPG